MFGMSFMQKGAPVRDPYKREKEDYKLNPTRTRGKKMWTIRVALACMCQHIDAQAKMLSSSIPEGELVRTG